MNITKDENETIIYVSIFATLIISVPRILIIFSEANPSIESKWNFNIVETIFQLFYQIFFCYSVGLIAIKKIKNKFSFNLNNVLIVCLIFLISFIFWYVGSNLQLLLFNNIYNEDLFLRTYFLRLFLSTIIILTTIKLLLHNRQKIKDRDLENEKIKSSYLNSKLENLKNQVNPHFLFNSFANLSALINKDQQKATEYLSSLSNVFRYSLNNVNEQIVDLSDELNLLKSYMELYKIRMLNGLSFKTDVLDTNKKILHMSLQPLFENVIKHNKISNQYPLTIYLKQEGDKLIFINDINKKKVLNSNGIGLTNLNERYKILTGKGINIKKRSEHFIVELPLF